MTSVRFGQKYTLMLPAVFTDEARQAVWTMDKIGAEPQQTTVPEKEGVGPKALRLSKAMLYVHSQVLETVREKAKQAGLEDFVALISPKTNKLEIFTKEDVPQGNELLALQEDKTDEKWTELENQKRQRKRNRVYKSVEVALKTIQEEYAAEDNARQSTSDSGAIFRMDRAHGSVKKPRSTLDMLAEDTASHQPDETPRDAFWLQFLRDDSGGALELPLESIDLDTLATNMVEMQDDLERVRDEFEELMQTQDEQTESGGPEQPPETEKNSASVFGLPRVGRLDENGFQYRIDKPHPLKRLLNLFRKKPKKRNQHKTKMHLRVEQLEHRQLL